MARTEADARWEKLLRALGLALMEVERHTWDGAAEGPDVHDIRIRLEQDNRTSVLLVLKAHGDGKELVGFVGGLRLEDAVLSLAKKLRAGVVKWREDRPWVPSTSEVPEG